MFDIVNNARNSIDVDKIDYIQRDCRSTSMAYTSFNPKLLLKEIKVIDTVILNKGEEIELLNENDALIMNTCFGQLELPFNQIKDSIKIKETIEVTLTELEDEDSVKEYRLQLDVKTTRRKSREIEKYLRETLERMI